MSKSAFKKKVSVKRSSFPSTVQATSTKAVEKPPQAAVEMVEVKHTVKRCGKPPRVVVLSLPKDHYLAKGA